MIQHRKPQNNRGIDPKTLQVFKIIQNYDLRRVDDTTAAQRLFGEPFPDLFESVLMQMDERSKARRYKKLVQPQTPTLHAVPSSIGSRLIYEDEENARLGESKNEKFLLPQPCILLT